MSNFKMRKAKYYCVKPNWQVIPNGRREVKPYLPPATGKCGHFVQCSAQCRWTEHHPSSSFCDGQTCTGMGVLRFFPSTNPSPFLHYLLFIHHSS